MTSFDPPSPAPEAVASPSPFTVPTNSAATNDAVPASAVPTNDAAPIDGAPTNDGPTSAVLPTMSDLDRLSASLDQVDRTLAELDGLPGLTPA